MRINIKQITAITVMTVAVIAAVTGCGSAPESTVQTSKTAKTATTVPVTTAASADFVNSYDNTAELSAKYPVMNPTPVNTELGGKIQNRLLSGFENWNRGYEAWKAWGDILYTKDSIYNVHGVRLTLPEYQASMNATLGQLNIQMGNFENMIICDDWAAIHYDISTTVKGKTSPGSVMEFVHFKDYGDPLGVRVKEGWGGPKDSSFESMSMFQTEEEKKTQQEALKETADYQIPDTDDLEKKYPVKNPTKDNSSMADGIRKAILEDFDSWNQGYDQWSANADNFYTSNAVLTAGGKAMTLDEFRTSVKETDKSTDTRKLYFDNMLISGDWAAIHYRYTSEDLTTKEKTAGDAMQFLHFVKEDNQVRVDKSWAK